TRRERRGDRARPPARPTCPARGAAVTRRDPAGAGRAAAARVATGTASAGPSTATRRPLSREGWAESGRQAASRFCPIEPPIGLVGRTKTLQGILDQIAEALWRDDASAQDSDRKGRHK